jgi:hypothetical protein
MASIDSEQFGITTRVLTAQEQPSRSEFVLQMTAGDIPVGRMACRVNWWKTLCACGPFHWWQWPVVVWAWLRLTCARHNQSKEVPLHG